MADTSIYRHLLQPAERPFLPSELEGQQLTLANIGLRNRQAEQNLATGQQTLRGMTAENDEREAAAARMNRVRELLIQHGPEAAIPEVMKVDPVAGQKLQAELDQRKAAVDEKKKELWTNFIGTVANAAPEKRAAAYKVGRAQMLSSGLFQPEEIREDMPTDDEISTALGLTMTPEQQRARAAAIAEEARKAELHKAQLPGQTADPKTGLTPSQAATAEHQKTTAAETERHNREMEKATREANAIRRTREAREALAAAGTSASERSKARSAITTIRIQEGSLARLSKQLADTITKGANYLRPNGTVVGLADEAARVGTTTDALRDDMKARYAGIVDEWKKAIAEKNDHLMILGKPIGKSTEQAFAELDQGAAKVLGATKPTSQTFSEAEVRARATARGVDPDAAVRAAKEKGLLR